MQIEEFSWFSNNLNREMPVRVYGHYGRPMIVFPCSQGRYFDYENMKMIENISGFINDGKIKVYCVDSLDDDTWFANSKSIADKNACYEAYTKYISEEVVPFIKENCGNAVDKIITNGCSMGAYHAVNFLLKFPEHFDTTIALSGLYRLDQKEFKITRDQIGEAYFNSPINYLGGLYDDQQLDKYRDMKIMLCTGQGKWEEDAIVDTRDMQTIFNMKGISAWVDFWGTDVDHDWPWWFKQMRYFLRYI